MSATAVESPRDACARLGLTGPLVTADEAAMELDILREYVRDRAMLQWAVIYEASGRSVSVGTFLQAVWEAGTGDAVVALIRTVDWNLYLATSPCAPCAADPFGCAPLATCRCDDEVRRVVPRLTLEMLTRGASR